MSSSSSEIAERLSVKAATRAPVRSPTGSATKLPTKRGRCWPPTRLASSTSNVSPPSLARPSTVFSRRTAKSNAVLEPRGISFRELVSRDKAEASSRSDGRTANFRALKCLAGHNIESTDANAASGRAISQSRNPGGWTKLRASNPATLTTKSKPARRTRRTNSSNLAINCRTSGRRDAEFEARRIALAPKPIANSNR